MSIHIIIGQKKNVDMKWLEELSSAVEFAFPKHAQIKSQGKETFVEFSF